MHGNSGRRASWRGRRSFLVIYVIGTGAAVMAVEFGGERLIQPFFGSSQLVWATLIGLILLALAVGYALGGRLADRKPDPAVLGAVTLGAGVFVAFLPYLAEPFLMAVVRGLLRVPAGVVVASLIGVSALFVPPVAALGVVSPFAVRLAVDETRLAGSRAGSLYAWSTFGSLLGTFLPTFWILPSFGVRATLWGSALVLILLGVLAIGRLALLPLALLPLLLARLAPPVLKPVAGLIREVETPYQFAQVYRNPSGDVVLCVNDSAGYQSVYTPSRLTGLYYDAYLTLPYLFPRSRPLTALLVGMAAGTIPTLYRRDVDPYRSRVDMTGVEIDPELIRLGRAYFHLRTSSAHVVIADGRTFLETSKHAYDILIVDAYSEEIYIPFTLTTEEFFRLARSHLRPGGILAMNVNATSPRSPLLLAMERTLRTVFPHVALAKAAPPYNYLLVASLRPLHPPVPRLLPAFLRGEADLLDRSWHAARPGPGLVLTDDRAPVEALTNGMILRTGLLPSHAPRP